MASTIGTAYVQVEPSFEGVVPKIDKEFGGAGKTSGSSFMSGFGSVLGTVGKVVAGATTAASAAVGGMVKNAVSAYSEFEQLEGGAKLLFGSAYETVMQNAEKAFATVQMSTNDYLETANSYAVGLKTALNGDEQAAADLTDKIITAQADVVAATGNSQEMVANAFSGIMKNNFTMLDNLQLGIKPTKEGMQEVIDKMNEWNKTQGRTTKYQMGNLADMQSAIVDYVSYVGMAGYAQKEGADTIQGALASTKAAWENLITSLGSGDTNKINENIDQLVETAGKLGEQVMPVVEKALTGIAQLIEKLAPEIASKLPGLITEILPGLLSAGVQIIQSLGEGILSAIPQLMPSITSVIMELSEMLISLLPQILTIGVQIIESIGRGLIDALPTLVPTLTSVIVEIATILTDQNNLQMLIGVAIDLILALVDGLFQAIPTLIEAVPVIISSLIQALVNGENITKLVQAALSLINSIVTNLPTIIQSLVDAIPQVIEALTSALTDPDCVTAIIQGAIQLVVALAAALPQICMALIDAIPQIIEAIVQAFMALGPALEQCIGQVLINLAPTFAEIGDYAQDAAAKVYQWFSELPTKLAYSAGQMVGNFINAMRNLPSQVSSVLSSVLNAVMTFVQNFIAQGPKAASQFAADLIAGLKKLPEQMLQIGKNIVNGIFQGIKDGWNKMVEKVQEMAESFVKGLKDTLEIGSPSKVMANEIGQWIPAGIAMGIQNGMGTLKATAASMTNDIIGAATVNAQVGYNYNPPAAPNIEMNQEANKTMALLAEYLPVIAKEISKPIEVNQNDRGMFEAVRVVNNSLVTATGYHALA